MTKRSKSYRAAAEKVHADVLYTPFWWRPLLAAYRALPEALAKRLAV